MSPAGGRSGQERDKERAPPRKRRRVVISCTECHRRKQKCDRDLPCGNCKSRNKEASCTYETGAPTARVQQREKVPLVVQPRQPSPQHEVIEPLSSMATDWGYAQNGASTLGFLKKIESSNGDGLATEAHRPVLSENDAATREKYKCLIRQLPAKTYIDKLIDMYMKGFNWQYYVLEPDVFYQQLDEWNRLPFSTLTSTGPHGLSKDLRAFPALLFQVIGIALLVLPESPDPIFDALKYAGNMTFEDLANDYCQSGMEILSLIGKRNLSVTTVQVQFLRSMYLKFTAKPTEAWHSIAEAIRDAQELGMHRDSLDPKPKDSSLESILENQWLVERRRRMYNLLAVWDINCALVLGRPGIIDWNQPLPTPPVDVSIPKDRYRTPVIPRDEKECPTPLTRMLWLYELGKPLKAIQNLEKDGPYPKDFSKVERLHREILELDERVPPAFRLDNPDTQWDDQPDMDWVQACRYYFAQLHQFSLMALHRPYVFNRKESRLEALQASLRMLELQKMTFQGLPPDSWRNFMLFFGSFDAIVLIASVYILFPHEHLEFKASVYQHFQWTIERFSAMQERNPLAKSAQGVLRAIVSRFKKALECPATATTTTRDDSVGGDSSETPASETKSSMESNLAATQSTPASSLGMADGYAYPQPPMQTDWMMPSADSLAGIAPMFPTHDLLFNDLSAVPDDMLMAPKMDGQPPMFDTDELAWQFGGAWGDDTVWGFLNQYHQQPGEQQQHQGASIM